MKFDRIITTYGSTESNPRTTSANFPWIEEKKNKQTRSSEDSIIGIWGKVKHNGDRHRKDEESEPFLSGTDKEVMVAP